MAALSPSSGSPAFGLRVWLSAAVLITSFANSALGQCSISTQPHATIVCPGAAAAFFAAANGATGYQWQHDGIDIVNGAGYSGATSQTLRISSAQPAFLGSYNCVISNGCGPPLITINATLSTSTGPNITWPPIGGSFSLGGTEMLEVRAISPVQSALTYRWRKDGQDLADGPTPQGCLIDGSDTAWLTMSGLRAEDAGSYEVVVSDSCGSITSQAVDVTVTCGPLWSERAPTVRTRMGMVFDSRRNVAVIFGGQTDESMCLRDTFEWDGSTMRHRATAGPLARCNVGMAYDSARGRTVLFGGLSPSTPAFGDTWEWDGTTWARRAVTGPSARSQPAMSFDAARNRVVLFGGRTSTGGVLSDTWEWDGAAWTQRATTGPQARYAAATCFNVSRGKVQMFGGYGSSGTLGDTWEWNGTSWTQRSLSSYPVYGHTMVYDTARNREVVYTGSATLEQVFSGWSTLGIGGPGPRSGMGVVYDTLRGRTMLFGGVIDALGIGSVYQNDMWDYNGTEWRSLSDFAPYRVESCSTFDTARQRLIVTSGVNGLFETIYNNTWESDGEHWFGRTTSAPYCYAAAMCYDSNRGRSVLFGGQYGSSTNITYASGTYEYNGTTWTNVATTGPSGRASHGVAYDPIRSRTVLFGGVNASGLLGDTWEWNGTTWTLASSTGPSARKGPSMTFHSGRGRVVLFGGAGPVGLPTGDLWEWNGVQWSLISDNGPAGSKGGLAYDAARDKLVQFGGSGVDFAQGQTWEWDNAGWVQRSTTGPLDRRSVTAHYHTGLQRVILSGGDITDSESWQWDGNVWSRLTRAPQSTRGAPAAFDSTRGRTVVVAPDSTSLQYMWEYDGAYWSALGRFTPPSWGPMVYDTVRHNMVLFVDTLSGPATWLWDGTSWTLSEAQTPAGHGGAAMVFDSVRGRTVLFGGGASPYPQDTWEWDGQSWTQVSTTGPPGRTQHAMAFDARRGRTVLFGSGPASSPPGDTWEWDGQAWTQVATTGPAGRSYPMMAYDSAAERVVLFGGLNGTTGYLSDLWTWDGQQWVQRSRVGGWVAGSGGSVLRYGGGGPQGRITSRMVYDSARNCMQLFGGGDYSTTYSYEVLSDFWEWRSQSASILRQPVSTTVCVGGAAYFSVGIDGLGATCQWRHDGTPIPGATGATLRIANAALTDGGTYDCIVSGGCASTTSAPAVLAICYANCDCSAVVPILNINDFQCFLNRFAASDPYANCDQSTTPPTLNVNDFQCFLNSFASGCS